MILEVDGFSGLEVGMQSKQTQEVIFGELRLALGGILINKDKLIVQVLKRDSPISVRRNHSLSPKSSSLFCLFDCPKKRCCVIFLQFEPQMDGCVREGRWLNLSMPWEAEAEELWLCYQNIQPGSFFSGKGLAVFNTSGGNQGPKLTKIYKQVLQDPCRSFDSGVLWAGYERRCTQFTKTSSSLTTNLLNKNLTLQKLST